MNKFQLYEAHFLRERKQDVNLEVHSRFPHTILFHSSFPIVQCFKALEKDQFDHRSIALSFMIKEKVDTLRTIFVSSFSFLLFSFSLYFRLLLENNDEYLIRRIYFN